MVYLCVPHFGLFTLITLIVTLRWLVRIGYVSPHTRRLVGLRYVLFVDFTLRWCNLITGLVTRLRLHTQLRIALPHTLVTGLWFDYILDVIYARGYVWTLHAHCVCTPLIYAQLFTLRLRCGRVLQPAFTAHPLHICLLHQLITRCYIYVVTFYHTPLIWTLHFAPDRDRWLPHVTITITHGATHYVCVYVVYTNTFAPHGRGVDYVVFCAVAR